MKEFRGTITGGLAINNDNKPDDKKPETAGRICTVNHKGDGLGVGTSGDRDVGDIRRGGDAGTGHFIGDEGIKQPKQ